MRKTLFFTALCLGCTAMLDAEEKTFRQVRFLAIGELPPFRQEVRDNIRYELEPPEGSIPPREIILRSDKEDSEATPLRLGQITAALKVPSGAGSLDLRQRDASKDTDPWLRLTRPEQGDFIVILWRDPKQGSWKKVRSLVLPEDAVETGPGSIRFINCSETAVGLKWGSEKLLLNPLSLIKRKVTTGVESPFQVLLSDKTGHSRPLHTAVVTQNPSERSLVLIYRADGASPRRPVKVSVLREPIPPPPEKKKKS
jgi:hypothetical protein